MGQCTQADSLPLFLLLFQGCSLHLWSPGSCRWIPPTSILLLHLLLAQWSQSLWTYVESPAVQATFCLISFPSSRVIPALELGAAAHPSSRADRTFFCNNSGQLLPFAQLAGHVTGQLWEYGFPWESVHFSVSPCPGTSAPQSSACGVGTPGILDWYFPSILLIPVFALPHPI